MPVYLRRFYMQKLVKFKEEEEKQIKQAQQKNSNIQRPNITSKFGR